MAFNWHHYLELAEQWQADLPNQNSQITDIHLATMRSIVSRAYYAAYWAARRYLENKTMTRFRYLEHSHKALVEKMKEMGGEAKTIGAQLKALGARRIEADYEVQPVFSKHDSQARLLVARNIIDRLSQL